MATKKTKTTKALRQLADALPPAYELHRSGGEVAGKLEERLRALPKEIAMADASFPKGCIIMPDHVTLWRPNVYKAKVNHYKRLLNAYVIHGEKGINDYLAGIKKIQAERRAEFTKQKQNETNNHVRRSNPPPQLS